MSNNIPLPLLFPKIGKTTNENGIYLESTERCYLPKFSIYGNAIDKNTVSIPKFDSMVDLSTANNNGFSINVRSSNIIFSYTPSNPTTITIPSGQMGTLIPTDVKYRNGHLYAYIIIFEADKTQTVKPYFAVGAAAEENGSIKYYRNYINVFTDGYYNDLGDNNYILKVMSGSFNSDNNREILKNYPYLALGIIKSTLNTSGSTSIKIKKIIVIERGNYTADIEFKKINSPDQLADYFMSQNRMIDTIQIPKSIIKDGVEIPLLFSKMSDYSGMDTYEDCLLVNREERKVIYKSYIDRYYFTGDENISGGYGDSTNGYSFNIDVPRFNPSSNSWCNFALYDGYMGKAKTYPTIEMWGWEGPGGKAQLYLNSGTNNYANYNTVDKIKTFFKNNNAYIEFLRCGGMNDNGSIYVEPLIIDCTEYEWAQQLLEIKQTLETTDITFKNNGLTLRTETEYLKYNN